MVQKKKSLFGGVGSNPKIGLEEVVGRGDEVS